MLCVSSSHRFVCAGNAMCASAVVCAAVVRGGDVSADFEVVVLLCCVVRCVVCAVCFALCGLKGLGEGLKTLSHKKHSLCFLLTTLFLLYDVCVCCDPFPPWLGDPVKAGSVIVRTFHCFSMRPAVCSAAIKCSLVEINDLLAVFSASYLCSKSCTDAAMAVASAVATLALLDLLDLVSAVVSIFHGKR